MVSGDDRLHTDNTLFAKIAGGDPSAYTSLFHLYHAELYNSALRYLKSEFWAEEIIQEVFAAIWNERHKLAAIQHPAGWLHRLVWNKSVDRMRKQEAELKVQYRLLLLADKDADVLPDQQKEKLFAALKQAIEQLSPQRRAVYELRYHNRLSLEEIAQKLKISRNTVRNTLAQTLENIRAHLLQHIDYYIVIYMLGQLSGKM